LSQLSAFLGPVATLFAVALPIWSGLRIYRRQKIVERSERLFEEKRNVYADFLKALNKYMIEINRNENRVSEWDTFEELLTSISLLSLYAGPSLTDQAYATISELRDGSKDHASERASLKGIANAMHQDLMQGIDEPIALSIGHILGTKKYSMSEKK